MAIVIAAALLAAGLVAAAFLYSRSGGRARSRRPGATAQRDEVERELLERRAEIARIEERVISKEEAIDVKLAELAKRERALTDREHEVAHQGELLDERKREHVRELERVANLSASQAKQILLKEVEDMARHDAARVVRQVEEEAKRDADRRVRNILSACMGRVAAGHAAETTVAVVQLPSDDMKGRIIGREGRNIRALEGRDRRRLHRRRHARRRRPLGFDGVRREIARLALEKLLADGRIHPARIEETATRPSPKLEEHIVELGEQAVLEANVEALDPDLVKLLGRLRYRTSYGQNVSSTRSSARTSRR